MCVCVSLCIGTPLVDIIVRYSRKQAQCTPNPHPLVTRIRMR